MNESISPYFFKVKHGNVYDILALQTNLAASKDLFCKPVEEPFAQELSPSMY